MSRNRAEFLKIWLDLQKSNRAGSPDIWQDLQRSSWIYGDLAGSPEIWPDLQRLIWIFRESSNADLKKKTQNRFGEIMFSKESQTSL